MSIRYSSLFARNVTRAIAAGVEVESSTFIYNGPKAERAGEAILIQGLYIPAVNGIATFNASAPLTDHVVLAEIPFGARVTRAQFVPSADLSSGTPTWNIGFGLVTPAGVVNVAGNNPTIETVFASSLTAISAGGSEATAIDATAAALNVLANATRPANRTADYYQLIVSPAATGAFNQNQLRFNVEYVWP
jgi:hypothetical protein